MLVLRSNYYSKNDNNKKNSPSLRDFESNRGIGRSALVSLLGTGGMVPGLVGGYVGKEHGLDLEKSGNYTDEEIKEKAGKRGALVGAAIGAPMGLAAMGSGLAAANRLSPELLEHIKFKKGGKWNKAALAGALASGLISGGVWSGAGSYLGAKKNISDRIEQRDKFEGIARNRHK